MIRRFCNLLIISLFLTAPAFAQLSRSELLELVDADTGVDALAARVERECVDFALDSHTLLDLAGTVPRVVLDAAIACTNRPDPGIGCQFYRALADEPMLADFPVVITNIRDGKVDLMVIESGPWIDEQDIGLGGTFKAIREHTKMVNRAEELATAIEGVRQVVTTRTTKFSTSTLARTQQRGIVASCASKHEISITSDPEGADVWIDRKRRGRTPIVLSMPEGEYDLRLGKRGFVDHEEALQVGHGADTRLAIPLASIPRASIQSQPDQAIVMINGKVVGRTPLELPIREGDQTLTLVKTMHAPFRSALEGIPGELTTINAKLAPVTRDDYCYPMTVGGGLVDSFSELQRALVSKRFRAAVPLYQVVTSTMESKLAANHVVDGDLLLFAPRRSDKYADRPSDLIGRELGGLAFGETARSLIETPPDVMIVTAVERKKASVKVEIMAESGQRNALFLDFTRPPKQVKAQDVLDALCVVFSRHPAFEESASEAP